MSGTGHYFDAEPSAPSRRRQLTLAAGDRTLELTTDAGTFSNTRVDPGTVVLLRCVPPPDDRGNLLDLGAGYGPRALSMAVGSPHATVWAVDVNERALDLVRTNAAANGLPNVRACRPDEVPDEIEFAGMWSNPPIRIGKPALHELLLRWLPRLESGAAALLVVQKHLGSDSLARWLDEQGYPTKRIASRQAYRVLEVRAARQVPAP